MKTIDSGVSAELARHKIAALTSVRFFAALFVFFYHGWPVILGHRQDNDLLSRTISFGYISVSFFFMLSGFILAIVYLRPGKPLRPRQFFISRFARIYPLYLAAVVIDLPHFLYTQRYITHGSLRQTIGTIVATLLLVQAWLPNMHGLDPPSWSLSAEAFFYLLFPSIGRVIARLGIGATLSLSCCVYVGGIASLRSLHETGQTYLPLSHLFVFVLGILLARVYGWIGEVPHRGRCLARAAPLMMIFALGALLAIPVFNLRTSEALMQHGLASPCFALIILALASDCQAITRPLSAAWLILLGEASFAFYLIHEPIGSLCRRHLEHHGMPMFLIYLASTIVLSVISLHFLEIPMRLWILKRERVRSPEGQVSSSIMQ